MNFDIINLMKSKNKIMDSFEEFIALPLSILKNRIIQITGFKSDFMSTKSINIELMDDKIQINCINNESAYNLLSSVIYKREQKRKAIEKQTQNENQNVGIFELANS